MIARLLAAADRHADHRRSARRRARGTYRDLFPPRPPRRAIDRAPSSRRGDRSVAFVEKVLATCLARRLVT